MSSVAKSMEPRSPRTSSCPESTDGLGGCSKVSDMDAPASSSPRTRLARTGQRLYTPQRLQQLNPPMVKVSAHPTETKDKDAEFFKSSMLLLLHHCCKEEIMRIKRHRRELRRFYYAGDIFGLWVHSWTSSPMSMSRKLKKPKRLMIKTRSPLPRTKGPGHGDQDCQES